MTDSDLISVILCNEEKDQRQIIENYVRQSVLSLPKLQASYSKSAAFVDMYSKAQIHKNQPRKLYSPNKLKTQTSVQKKR